MHGKYMCHTLGHELINLNNEIYDTIIPTFVYARILFIELFVEKFSLPT